MPAPLQAIPLHQQLHSNYAVPSIQESGDLFYMPALLAYSMNNIPNCFKKSEEMEAEFSWKDASFVYLLDMGGQPSFQDALPLLLLDAPCTYIQVFNLATNGPVCFDVFFM